MKKTVFLLAALVACEVNIKQICSLQVDTMDSKTRIDVKDPSWNYLSSGILKSHIGSHYDSGKSKSLTLSAPKGYGILVAFRLLDLRPTNQDVLSLYSPDYSTTLFTYSNRNRFQDTMEDLREQRFTIYEKSGQMVVTFTTGPGLTYGYGGFALTYTSQANSSMCKYDYFHCMNKRCIADPLKCDGHNHCGDRSEQTNCHSTYIYTSEKNHAGLIAGVVFLLIAAVCIIFMVVRRGLRSRVETETVINHPPPPTNLPRPPPSYQEPGTYYPPPPPPYSQYDQGITNPGYH